MTMRRRRRRRRKRRSAEIYTKGENINDIKNI